MHQTRQKEDESKVYYNSHKFKKSVVFNLVFQYKFGNLLYGLVPFLCKITIRIETRGLGLINYFTS